MNLSVAVSSNWGIGINNDLLFSIPTDMKFFRSNTCNKTVVMGYNTLLSFPNQKPLPKRNNIVLSRKPNLVVEGAVVCHSLTELAQTLDPNNTNDIWVIGGDSIYSQLLDYCETAVVTKVTKDVLADKFFPNLDENDNWELVKTSPVHNDGDAYFTFNWYKNKIVKSLWSDNL